MIRKDGGTAFPMQDPQAIHAYAQAATEAAKHDSVDDRDQTYLAARAEAIGGMSLRDYLAAKAMQGMISNGDWISRMSLRTGDKPDICVSAAAYEVADAMLAERAK